MSDIDKSLIIVLDLALNGALKQPIMRYLQAPPVERQTIINLIKHCGMGGLKRRAYTVREK